MHERPRTHLKSFMLYMARHIHLNAKWIMPKYFSDQLWKGGCSGNLEKLMTGIDVLKSQQKLAEASGTEGANIDRIKHGEASPAVKSVALLARAIGLQAADMLRVDLFGPLAEDRCSRQRRPPQE